MIWQPPEGMDEYLKPTELCDCDNPEIREKAKGIIAVAKTPREAAIDIFYFVRDQILFGYNHNTKASETLRSRIGYCATKANLQVAPLRSSGIPARYHQAVLAKSCLKGIIPAFGYMLTPERLEYHPWCECCLSDKWIACDTLYDKRLYDAARKKSIISKEQIPTIDWDGENDLNTRVAWILEDRGTFPSFEDIFRKNQKETFPVKIFTEEALFISNRYTNQIRIY